MLTRERSSEAYDPIGMKAQVGAEQVHAETQPGPAPTRALASGRIQSCAVAPTGSDVDDSVVAKPIARSTEARMAKAVVRDASFPRSWVSTSLPLGGETDAARVARTHGAQELPSASSAAG